MQEETRKQEIYDIVILGGGPAGMSAAMWAADLGLGAILIERSAELGGQLLQTYNPIRNYLGLETENGRGLRDVFASHLDSRGVRARFGAEVVGLNAERRTVSLSSGDDVSGRALILALGVRRRRLDVPGEDEFAGRGIIDSGKRNVDKVYGKRVVIVGGGDAALENALMLAENAASVTVVHRRPEFAARDEFVEQVRANPKIKVLTETIVRSINGFDRVESVSVRSGNGQATELAADTVLVRIGVEPNSSLMIGQVEADSAGYVIVDRECRTNRSGVYAIGDIANPKSPTVSSAAGMGATAVKSILCWLNE